MQAQARSKYLKISAKKMRLVAVTIKGMDVSYALDYLKFHPQKASPLIWKTLHAAIANAEHNFNLDSHNLLIKEIFADEGKMLKRWRARAFGRAASIHKKSAHLTIILEEKVPTNKDIKPKKEKLKEPSVLKDDSLETKTKTSEDVSSSTIKQVDLKENQDIKDVQEQDKKYHQKQNFNRTHDKSKAITLKKIFRRKSI